MEKRTFENLTIEKGEELILPCDVEITGKLIINGGILIVAGELRIGELFFCSSDPVSTINGGDISVGSLFALGDIQINDSDLYVNGTLASNSIFSDSDILVGGDSFVSNVSCLNYMVEGNNDSCDITAIQDIYIGGNSDSYDLACRDLYVGGNVDANDHNVTVHGLLYAADGITNCNQLTFG